MSDEEVLLIRNANQSLSLTPTNTFISYCPERFLSTRAKSRLDPFRGKGERGGIRIMYYWKKSDKEIWLLTLYSKSERATIPGHILKKIAEEIENE